MSYKLYFLPFLTIIKHWRIKPLQLFLMIAGLTSATALWNSIHLINSEAKKAYSDAQIISTISTEKTLVSRTSLHFDDAFFGELRQLGWPVTPRLEGELPNSAKAQGSNVIVIGIDPLSAGSKINTDAFPTELSQNAFLEGTKVIIAGPDTAETIRSRTKFQNVKSSKHFPEGYAITDISIAQQILKRNNQLTNLQLVGPIPNQLQDIKVRGLKINLNESKIDLNRLTKSFHLNLTAFGLLSYLVALFIVYSTVTLAFEQRKGILKALRSLGLSSVTITTIVLFEIFVISAISGILGVILSYFLAAALLPDVAMTLNGLFGANIKNSMSLNSFFWSSSISISTFGALFASVPTLWKSIKLSPLDSAKKVTWFEKTKANLKYQLIGAAVLSSVIAYSSKFGSGIISAFLFLGSTLVTTTLLLPIFLWLTLSLVNKYKFKSPLLGWFFADCKQQINSLSVSLMALLLALAVNVGVGGMVESFRKTFNGWLDQRLVSELYIRAPNLLISGEIKALLTEKVDAILPIVKVPQKIAGVPTDIYGFSPHQTYIDHWPLIYQREDAWNDVKEGMGIIINEQLSRRLNLNISNVIEFESKLGKIIRHEIVGVYSDYGNPKGQIMVPLKLFEEYFPDEPELNFAIRMDKNEITALQNELDRNFSKTGITVTNQIEIKNLSTKIFEKTFTVTAALSILTLGIAGMALFTSLTALADNRYAQLAPLWAIGTKRKTLAILEALRSVALSALTFIFAVPIGLGVVFILTNHVNPEAFGWKLPIFYFPGQWLSLLLTTVIITLLASGVHSIKLAKASPAELLKASQYDT